MGNAESKDNSKCPVCGGPHLEGGFVEICGLEAVQAVSCTACGAGWDEVYAFARRASIETWKRRTTCTTCT